MTSTLSARAADPLPSGPRAMAHAGGLHGVGVFILLAGALLPIMDLFITNAALPGISAS